MKGRLKADKPNIILAKELYRKYFDGTASEEEENALKLFLAESGEIPDGCRLQQPCSADSVHCHSRDIHRLQNIADQGTGVPWQ